MCAQSKRKQTDPRLKIIQCLCDDNTEDGVRPAALLVHVGGGNSARLVPL